MRRLLRRPRRPAALAAAVLLPLFPLAGCSDETGDPMDGPAAVLTLVSPPSPPAPLGLHYGEQATLLFRYRNHGQPEAGVTLKAVTDGDAGGATLSAERLVTSDRGEAGVVLTAGASETAFHVVVSAPSATDLIIDAAVSRYAFGSIDVLIDGTMLGGPGPLPTAVRGTLFGGTLCAQLPPLPKPGPGLRTQRASEPRSVLTFATLLVQPYSIAARAEDDSGHLLGYGCLDVPEQLLKTGQRAVVVVPMQPVHPSPVGSYTLTTDLANQPPEPWPKLGCATGTGQVLLDAVLAGVKAVDADLAMRLSALRAMPDAMGCRTAVDKLDAKLHAILTPSTAGMTFSAVAGEALGLLRGGTLTSELVVRAAAPQPVGDHSLRTLRFDVGMRSSTLALDTLLGGSATELPLAVSGSSLTVPTHRLSLRLASQWQRGVQELVLTPRGISTMSVGQLFTAAVTAAQRMAASDCSAVEALVCEGVAAPCVGVVRSACLTGKTATAQALDRVFSEPMLPSLETAMSFKLTLLDPDGTLKATALGSGQLTGASGTAAGDAGLGGTSRGVRVGP